MMAAHYEMLQCMWRIPSHQRSVHHLLFMMKVLLCCCVDNWVKVVMISSPSDEEHSTAAG
jgi:hypothetical protein